MRRIKIKVLFVVLFISVLSIVFLLLNPVSRFEDGPILSENVAIDKTNAIFYLMQSDQDSRRFKIPVLKEKKVSCIDVMCINNQSTVQKILTIPYSMGGKLYKAENELFIFIYPGYDTQSQKEYFPMILKYDIEAKKIECLYNGNSNTKKARDFLVTEKRPVYFNDEIIKEGLDSNILEDDNMKLFLSGKKLIKWNYSHNKIEKQILLSDKFFGGEVYKITDGSYFVSMSNNMSQTIYYKIDKDFNRKQEVSVNSGTIRTIVGKSKIISIPDSENGSTSSKSIFEITSELAVKKVKVSEDGSILEGLYDNVNQKFILIMNTGILEIDENDLSNQKFYQINGIRINSNVVK